MILMWKRTDLDLSNFIETNMKTGKKIGKRLTAHYGKLIMGRNYISLMMFPQELHEN